MNYKYNLAALVFLFDIKQTLHVYYGLPARIRNFAESCHGTSNRIYIFIFIEHHIFIIYIGQS